MMSSVVVVVVVVVIVLVIAIVTAACRLSLWSYSMTDVTVPPPGAELLSCSAAISALTFASGKL
jgi:hypothetical protein